MNTLCRKLLLKTTRVSFFKKWLMNQHNIYSVAQITYSPDVFVMHGSAIMENVMLCNTMFPPFFDVYVCNSPTETIEMNMYHLYKIIGRVTSFRYNSITIEIYDATEYKMVVICFKTENKSDEYHIRCPCVKQPTSILQIIPNKSDPYITVHLDGAVLCAALSKFETDVFHKVSFAFKLNKHRQAMLCMDTTETYMLALRGQTDMMKGVVSIPIQKYCYHSNTRNTRNHNVEFEHLQQFKMKAFSIESLSKCVHFYHLSESKTVQMVFYTVSNVLMLIFPIKNSGRVEVLLPPVQTHYDTENYVSSPSSSDSE
jgi:hypothetical protein